jgi:hypothetical protein
MMVPFTRAEKHRRIIEMYRAGHTIREIASEVHMNFSDISAVIKKESDEDGGENYINSKLSEETNALKLFEEGKAPVAAAIQLDISPEDAENWYMDYWRLKNQHHLFLLYKQIKCELPSFIKLFNMLRNARITERDAVNFISNSNQIPDLQNTFVKLNQEITNLAAKRNIFLNEVSDLQNKAARLSNYLQIGQNELNRINFEIMQRTKELQDIDRLVNAKFKDYVRYK